MNIYDLDENKLAELKEHLEVMDNKVLTKKIQEHGKMISCITGKEMLTGGTRASVGKERGGSNRYGRYITFIFSDKEKMYCKSRELIWVFENGFIPSDKSVSPINSDKMDDRIDNLQLIKRSKNGRPRGATDKKKRAKRIDDGYSKRDISKVKEIRDKGLNMKEIASQLGLSYDQVRIIVKKHLKPHINMADLMRNCETVLISDLYSLTEKSGVYVISFQGESFNKFYIGSSVNIKRRILAHRKSMEENNHYNKGINEAYRADHCKVRVHVWEECSKEELLRKENDLIKKYCKGSLLNKWNSVSKEEIQEYLDIAVTRITPDKYEVAKNGCWLWKSKRPDGTEKEMQISLRHKIFGRFEKPRHLKPHRVSYYKATGEYPEAVKRKCGNASCINPKCLAEGSAADREKHC
tara:strand:- start:326 stop:1552 length:1227 start_codon:yes stop_codon:yes gene_type:complete